MWLAVGRGSEECCTKENIIERIVCIIIIIIAFQLMSAMISHPVMSSRMVPLDNQAHQQVT